MKLTPIKETAKRERTLIKKANPLLHSIFEVKTFGATDKRRIARNVIADITFVLYYHNYSKYPDKLAENQEAKKIFPPLSTDVLKRLLQKVRFQLKD